MAAGRPGVTVHALDRNRGKGHAVRAGMARAVGELRLMADADGATPIAEVERLEAAVAAGADIAVGSRVLEDPSVVRQVRAHRQLSGHVFNFLLRRLGVAPVLDTQCGFKLFRAAAAAALFRAARHRRLRLRRRAADPGASAAGYRVVEVAVNWADQPGSKVRVLREGPRMLVRGAGRAPPPRWRARPEGAGA